MHPLDCIVCGFIYSRIWDVNVCNIIYIYMYVYITYFGALESARKRTLASGTYWVDWFTETHSRNWTNTHKHTHKRMNSFAYKSICLFVCFPYSSWHCYFCCCRTIQMWFLFFNERNNSVMYTHTCGEWGAANKADWEKKTTSAFRQKCSIAFWFHLLLHRHSLFRSN